MNEIQWKTAITDDKDGAGRIRGYKIDSLIGGKSFTETAWLLIRGELPSVDEAAVFDALLVAMADHGIAVPSVTAARIVASGGNPVNAAIAAGVLAAGDAHGGAIEGCMRVLASGRDAATIVSDAKTTKTRIPGFGHKIFKDKDPRTARLFEVARSRGFAGKFFDLAEEIGRTLALPTNVDGAAAAILLALGFPPEAGKAIFIIARTAGIAAHVIEEKMREKPFRRLPEGSYEYDGPPPRDL